MESELLNAPRHGLGDSAMKIQLERQHQALLAGKRASADFVSGQHLTKNLATFLYTSANNNDLDRLSELAMQFETIEWQSLDVRHPKFDDVDDNDFDMGDCDEDATGMMFDSINVHSLSTNSNNLNSIITKNKNGDTVRLGPPRLPGAAPL